MPLLSEPLLLTLLLILSQLGLEPTRCVRLLGVDHGGLISHN